MYLSKLQNVFVQISNVFIQSAKCICNKLENIFVQIIKCIGLKCKIYFSQIAKYVCPKLQNTLVPDCKI